MVPCEAGISAPPIRSNLPALLAILAAIAKQERVRLSERVHAGLNRAKAQGKVL